MFASFNLNSKMKAKNFMKEMKHKLKLTEEALQFSSEESEEEQEEVEHKRQRTPPPPRRTRDKEAKDKTGSKSCVDV